MSFSANILNNNERITYELRRLYRQYGYILYKVSKFEEYDLYAYNKSFLVSRNILTFTDTNGKLLALKPDVTLSIIKNIPNNDTQTHKFCYNETVYRTSSESDGFREIMQTGLECIGTIDLYAESEVIMLAMQSLRTVSEDYVLDLSHMGMIDGLLEQARVPEEEKGEVLQLIESKNLHALKQLCDTKKMPQELIDKLCVIAEMYLPICEALPILEPLVIGEKMQQAYKNLAQISEMMKAYGMAEKLYLDFSVVNDVNYYDGISFKGFINGVPNSILSGGRYDRLLNRLGKRSGAIGFAVYHDRLERVEWNQAKYDVDTVLLYDENVSAEVLIGAQKQLQAEGKSVITVSKPDSVLRYRQIVKISNGGLEVLETND